MSATPARIEWKEADTNGRRFLGEDSPFGIDFENYTLGRLVDGRSPYDFDHDEYRKVRAKVLWRVQELGWSAIKFQKIDKAIASDRYEFGRVVDEHHKVDRYGKKYCKIAYSELKGWLFDQGLLREREGCGRTSDVDIDPSFPDLTAEHQFITTDLLGDPAQSLSDWIGKGPSPDFTPFLRQATIQSEAGPWIALDGSVIQQDESRGRRLFAFVRTFMVAKDKARTLASALAMQPLGGRWLPEKPQSIYTFTGEIPWSAAFGKNGRTDLRFRIGERKVKVKRKRPALFLGDKELSQEQVSALHSWFSAIQRGETTAEAPMALKDVQRIVPREVVENIHELQTQFCEIATLIPVHDLGWEGRNLNDVSAHGIVLAKELARTAGLVHLPQTHDLQTKEGVRATYGTATRTDDYNNSERFFFLKESILRPLLKKSNMCLLWVVWGERQLSFKQMERARPSGDLAGFSHGDFQAVVKFS